MSGSETQKADEIEQEWIDLFDPSTDRVVGQVTRAGDVRSDDPDITTRVRSAFQRDLMATDGELAEELGVCFAGVETVQPGNAAHRDLVFRNLGVLTGLIPQRRERQNGV